MEDYPINDEYYTDSRCPYHKELLFRVLWQGYCPSCRRWYFLDKETMEKLKTLKELGEQGDFTICGCGEEVVFEGVSQEDLRKEAIKWIKQGYKQLIDIDDRDGRMSIRGGIAAFKAFFNITEGDLK